jgi:hypothetical protein
MRTLLLAALLAGCTARADHAAPTPTPSPATVAPATAAPATVAASAAAPRLADSFDTALLCTNILETGKRLGDPNFGMTESDPPAPSTVGAVTYRFGNEPRLLVAGMRAELRTLGPVTFGGRTIPSSATLDEIAAMQLDGCGALQHNEGGNVVECRVGDVHVTFGVGSIRDTALEVSAWHDACH